MGQISPEDSPVTQQSSIAVAGDVIPPAMTRPEAQECVVQIKRNIETAWQLVLDLRERRGWEALGYKNWRECMAAEFDVKQAQAYRMLNAATINKAITDAGLPAIPETHARALTPVIDDPDKVRKIAREVHQQAPKPTAAAYHEAVVRAVPKPTGSSRGRPRQSFQNDTGNDSDERPIPMVTPTVPDDVNGSPSPSVVIATLMRKAYSLDTLDIASRLVKINLTPDDARAVSRWFAGLAEAMETV